MTDREVNEILLKSGIEKISQHYKFTEKEFEDFKNRNPIDKIMGVKPSMFAVARSWNTFFSFLDNDNVCRYFRRWVEIMRPNISFDTDSKGATLLYKKHTQLVDMVSKNLGLECNIGDYMIYTELKMLESYANKSSVEISNHFGVLVTVDSDIVKELEKYYEMFECIYAWCGLCARYKGRDSIPVLLSLLIKEFDKFMETVSELLM